MSTTPPQTQTRRPSLPTIPIPMNGQMPGRAAPITPIGYARSSGSRRSSISSSLPSSTNQISFPLRRGSISSISSISTNRNDDEGAIVEDDDYVFNPNTASKKEEGLTFARRMSFGARALGGVVNKGPLSPVGPVGRDSEPRTTGLKDHLDGQRSRMSIGANVQSGLKGVDNAVQGKGTVKTAALEMDPFEERMVRGELYLD